MLKKSKLKNILSVFAVLTLFATVLLGCSSGNSANSGNTSSSAAPSGAESASPSSSADPNEKIELRMAWWGNQVRNERTLEVIKMFEAKNPNIKITGEFADFDGHFQKMATQSSGNSLPDILQMDYIYLAEYVDKGLLADLNPYVDSGVLNFADVDDQFISGGRLNDKLYAVSLGANALTLAYDPAMFAKAGVPELKPGYTWQDFVDTAYALKDKLGKDVWINPLYSDSQEFKHLLRQKGAWLYNDEGTALGYDDDKYFIDFWTNWEKMRKDGISPPAELTANISDLKDQLIVSGKSPFLPMHSNEIVALTELAKRPIKLMVYPTDPDGEMGHYIKPSQFFSVSSTSKHAEAAAKFIDFFTNDVEANKVLGAERGVPISTKVRDELYQTLPESSKLSFDYIDLVQQYSDH